MALSKMGAPKMPESDFQRVISREWFLESEISKVISWAWSLESDFLRVISWEWVLDISLENDLYIVFSQEWSLKTILLRLLSWDYWSESIGKRVWARIFQIVFSREYSISEMVILIISLYNSVEKYDIILLFIDKNRIQIFSLFDFAALFIE